MLKFYLLYLQLIGFHPWENLALAAFVIIPLQQKIWRVMRALIAVPAALLLFYYDSWFPPLGRVLSQATQLQHFSLNYWGELLGRLVDYQVVAIAVVICAVYLLITRWVRVGLWILIALCVMPFASMNPAGVSPVNSISVASAKITSGPSSAKIVAARDLNTKLSQQLAEFYEQEKQRVVHFDPLIEDDEPFDILMIHVCSLSWDDLEFTGLLNHPLWRRFDVLLNNFNTAASYSGPAAVRILRASCGQPSHLDLYTDAPQQCYLFDNLKSLGFDSELAMNHDGHFDDFSGLIRARGKLNATALSLQDMAAVQHGFDGSPIFSDKAVLQRWLDQRSLSDRARTATFYNTISLHDGNRLAGRNAGLNSLENFKPRMRQLLDDLNSFIDTLERSERRVALILVPEHGAAMRGDKIQIAGLREIPSPKITHGPAAIKMIGAGLSGRHAPVQIEEPTSYLAIAELIRRLIKDNPFTQGDYDPAVLARELPVTRSVSANEGTVVMGTESGFHLQLTEGDWVQYPGDRQPIVPDYQRLGAK